MVSDKQLPIYVELNTKTDNPRLPERPGKFKNVTDDNLVNPRSHFGVTQVYLHDEKVSPKAGLGHMHRLIEGDSASTASDLARRFHQIVQETLKAWQENRASDDDIVWIDWLLRERLITNSRNLTPALRSLTEEYRTVESSLPPPSVIYSMGDFDRGWDNPIFTGGSASSLGRPAPRHFLTLMPSDLRPVGLERSGRKELAEAIASPGNPLTARVMVNRIWHYVFGRGLVGTTDNFGNYGDKPTHPELLDYLAARFVEDGWSVKKMIRLLVTSETFRQASDPDASAREADALNTLWSHYPVRRLEGEAIRDAILAVSGRLDPTLYGPSIQPHRGEPKEYRRLFQGPLDGSGRRSVYLKVTRMEGPRFLEIFDLPPPLQTRGNRDVTNVPSQSLTLLNDPFVIEQAGVWAGKLTSRSDDSINARLTRMFEDALGRPPSDDELQRWRALAERVAAERGTGADGILASTPVWTDIAHTLFNTKEFLYLR
jgi:hypothetical protein